MSGPQDGFLLPGVFDYLEDGTPVAFHEAGFDNIGLMLDPPDIFPNDPDLEVESPDMRARETLPQFGPTFMRAMYEQISAVDEKLDKLRKEAMERWEFEPVTVVQVGSMQTTAAGAINRQTTNNAIFYEVPPGFTLAIHRFTILAVGFTPAVPFNGAGSWWELRVNDETLFGRSTVLAAANGGALPAFESWGTRDAIRARDGEQLSLFMQAGPANTALTVKMQGTLERTIEG